eukprot:TRINITY_DN64598_c0_g1_i1.p1 TRINITY_DN64598_c0_g1~~TRINITY_DN64598_c0_g1_i1.p1  ORF type:complete len:280 (-),score=20.09 TRINITY_DN64598_c0_g1_i1:108-947(-)
MAIATRLMFVRMTQRITATGECQVWVTQKICEGICTSATMPTPETYHLPGDKFKKQGGTASDSIKLPLPNPVPWSLPDGIVFKKYPGSIPEYAAECSGDLPFAQQKVDMEGLAIHPTGKYGFGWSGKFDVGEDPGQYFDTTLSHMGTWDGNVHCYRGYKMQMCFGQWPPPSKGVGAATLAVVATNAGIWGVAANKALKKARVMRTPATPAFYCVPCSSDNFDQEYASGPTIRFEPRSSALILSAGLAVFFVMGFVIARRMGFLRTRVASDEIALMEGGE